MLKKQSLARTADRRILSGGERKSKSGRGQEGKRGCVWGRHGWVREAARDVEGGKTNPRCESGFEHGALLLVG